MKSDKSAKLVKMANQIGDYFAPRPPAEAAAGAADHLRQFWTPKMIREIVDAAAGGDAGLNPTAADAVKLLN